MLLAVVTACGAETVEVPGETVVVEKVVTETVEVPGGDRRGRERGYQDRRGSR